MVSEQKRAQMLKRTTTIYFRNQLITIDNDYIYGISHMITLVNICDNDVTCLALDWM